MERLIWRSEALHEASLIGLAVNHPVGLKEEERRLERAFDGPVTPTARADTLDAAREIMRLMHAAGPQRVMKPH